MVFFYFIFQWVFFSNREADQLFYEASETTKLKSDFEKGNIAAKQMFSTIPVSHNYCTFTYTCDSFNQLDASVNDRRFLFTIRRCLSI